MWPQWGTAAKKKALAQSLVAAAETEQCKDHHHKVVAGSRLWLLHNRRLVIQCLSIVTSVFILLVLLTLTASAGSERDGSSGLLGPQTSSRSRARFLRKPLSSSSAMPLTSPTRLSDVFISVKTSHKFHKSRLPVLLKTWFQLARDETWFFTDTEDEELQAKTSELSSAQVL